MSQHKKHHRNGHGWDNYHRRPLFKNVLLWLTGEGKRAFIILQNPAHFSIKGIGELNAEFFFFLSSPSPVRISAATCSIVHGGLLGNGQSHNGDVSHLITQTCQQTAEPRWSDSSLILQLFSCRSQSHGESWIKHRFSVILTTAVKHILMKLEMQKIFSDKSARTAQPEVNPGLWEWLVQQEGDWGDVESWTLRFWQEEASFISNPCHKQNFPTINSF